MIPELRHLLALVVVVDTDRDPQEVVTWMCKRSLKKEEITEGVIYDSMTAPMKELERREEITGGVIYDSSRSE